MVVKNYNIDSNQFIFKNEYYYTRWYDTESIVYAVSLANEVKRLFGININIPNNLIEQANYYRGKSVYGNIQIPQKFTIEEDVNNYFKLIEHYDYNNGVKGSKKRNFDRLTKDEVIEIATDLITCLSNINILDKGFIALMGSDSTMGCYKAHEIAKKIISYYKPFVSEIAFKKGVKECNDILKYNRDAEILDF